MSHALLEAQNLDEKPSADQVRAALQRVIAHSNLNHAPKLASFLRYMVEAELAGRTEYIKGYTIATEALGRDESFRPADRSDRAGGGWAAAACA